MKQRGLKQVEAAKLFGVRQPDVSKLLRGEFRQFSVERLLRFLVALGQDVDIVVRPHKGRRAWSEGRIPDTTWVPPRVGETSAQPCAFAVCRRATSASS